MAWNLPDVGFRPHSSHMEPLVSKDAEQARDDWWCLPLTLLLRIDYHTGRDGRAQQPWLCVQ